MKVATSRSCAACGASCAAIARTPLRDMLEALIALRGASRQQRHRAARPLRGLVRRARARHRSPPSLRHCQGRLVGGADGARR